MKQTGISRSLSQSLRLGIAAMALTVSAAAFAQATYVLGCSLPLSGRMMGFGEPMRVGAEVAVEEMNKSPKNKGLKFELQCFDSKGDPKETINIGQRLIDQPKVIASLSDFTSTATMAAAETYKNGKLLQITPDASHPDLTKMNEWMFRAGTTIPNYIRPTADFVIDKLKAKRVAVLQVQTDWGASAGKNFIEQFKSRGGEIVSHDVYNEGQTDFRAILTQIRRTNPDAIFLAMLEEEAVNVLRQKKQFAMKQPVMDSSVGLTPRSLGLGGAAMEGVYAMTMFSELLEDPIPQRFAKAYRAKSGNKAPDVWGAYGYDAAMLVMEAAVRAAPSVTRASVRDQLANTKNFQGANGLVSIDPPTREVVRGKPVFTQVKDGKQIILK
jgi:branched-chain amino acid transport system substrate-binding protein